MKEQAHTPTIQIRLRTLLVITAAVAVLFGVLRWLEVPPQASLIVLAILGVGAAAAVGLVAIIAGSLAAQGEATDRDRDERDQAPDEPVNRDPKKA
jgi:hypothetical protein